MDKALLLFNIDKKMRDFGSLLLTVKRIPFFVKNRKVFSENRNLINKKNSEKCYILGMGPSLKNVDISKIADGDIFVTNMFYRFDQSKNISPLLYFMVDPLFYSGENESDLLQAMNKFPECNFVLNGKYLDKSKAKSNVFWWCGWGPDTVSEKIDMTKIMPSTSNVVGTAIATAIYMGYQEIILLGCDFSSFASQKNVHCYDTNDGNDRTLDLFFDLYCYSFVAKQHMELYEVAKKKGIEILNATKGSLIDAYPRIELEFLNK